MENNRTQIQFINTFGQTGPEGIIDVDVNSQFPINFAISDIKDPFSRKGTKSYKFTIIGTKEINILLNHYYDINVVDGTYDHNKKQKVVVLRNGVIILDNAYLQLMQINKKTFNDIYSDQTVTYDVEVGNDVTSFFTDITNKYLTDLDFQDMNHLYTSANVVASFPNVAIKNLAAGTDGFKYVLPYSDDNQYMLEEMRPAISVYEYWNRIHQAAGYQWSWVGFDTAKIRMDKLWIPYNGDKPKISNPSLYEVIANSTNTFTNSATTGAGTPHSLLNKDIIIDVEEKDLLTLYDPTTGIYTSNIYTGTSALEVQFLVTYDFSLDNTSGAAVELQNMLGFPQTNLNINYIPHLGMRNTATTSNNSISTSISPVVQITDIAISSPASSRYSLASGVTSLASGTILTSILPLTGIAIGDTFASFNGAKCINTGAARWVGGGVYVEVDSILTITSIKMIIVPRVDTYGYNTLINMNDFVPLKIKQSDFIKSIANMYNLVMDIDSSNEKLITYTLRDDYYDAGAEKNWTQKMDISKDSNIQFISNSNAKKIILSYKEDKDQANVDYTSATKEVYGQLEYELENENIKGTETKEIIFSPSPIVQTIFGAYVPFWAGAMPKNNIRILLDGGVQSTGLSGTQTYDIVDYGTTSGGVFTPVVQTTGISTYPMLTHFDNPLNPIFDINFGLCDQYWYPFNSQTNNNLYSMFWRRTIGQIDNGKLLTAYFMLNEYDISILKLNDKIWIKDTWYNINSLQYDPNSYGSTKVVLMTIDDLLKLNVVNTTPTVYVSQGNPTLSSTFNRINAIRNNSLNNKYSDSSVLVLGKNVTTTADIRNTIVVGDNKVPTESNTIYANQIISDKIIVNGKNIADPILFTDTLQTTDATTTTITTIDIPDDTMIYIRGLVNGYQDTFAAAIGVFYLAVFRKTGGVVTQVGTTTINSKDDFSSSPIIDVNTDGTSILVDIKGIAATTINWTNTYEFSLS